MIEAVFSLALALILIEAALTHIISAEMERLGYPDLTF